MSLLLESPVEGRPVCEVGERDVERQAVKDVRDGAPRDLSLE